MISLMTSSRSIRSGLVAVAAAALVAGGLSSAQAAPAASGQGSSESRACTWAVYGVAAKTSIFNRRSTQSRVKGYARRGNVIYTQSVGRVFVRTDVIERRRGQTDRHRTDYVVKADLVYKYCM